MTPATRAILEAVQTILRDSPDGLRHNTAMAAADLLESALTLEADSAAPATAALPIPGPPQAPEKKARKIKRARRSVAVLAAGQRAGAIREIQAIIDEAHTHDIKKIMSWIYGAGISAGVIAELIGCRSVQAVYDMKNGHNQSAEAGFWAVFSKPNITPREED